MGQKTLLEQAEEARQAGRRDEFLRLKKEDEQMKYNALQEGHKARVEAVKKEFPIDTYIEELNAKVTEIKDGCGTKSGWIEITLSGGAKYEISELRQKIAARKESRRVSAKFQALKFPTTGRCYIGEYTEAVDDLITYMDMKRIWTLQQWDDRCYDDFSQYYSDAHDQAINDGYTDIEAEEKALNAESDARAEAWNEYKDKVIESVNYLLSYADLELEEGKKGKYYIVPLTSWKHSADKMAEVISGYGTFEFRSGQELKESLPARTYCEAVIVHLHWLVKGPEVYGNKSYDYMMR